MTTTTQNPPKLPPKNLVNWFEIPVSDLAKSTRLYEAMLDTTLEQRVFAGVPHAVLSNQDRSCVSGSLVVDPKRPPMRGNGTVLYLAVPDGVARALSRAVEAGAKVVQPLTAIDPHGTIALIEDLDGNLIGLHANPQ